MGSEDKIAEGPPSRRGGTPSTERTPIGVPADFRAVVPGTRRAPSYGWDPRRSGRMEETTTRVAPIYFDGDEYKPAGQSPVKIAEIQQQLARAGLLTEYRVGYWDDATQKAYRSVLEQANMTGEPDTSVVLARMSAAPVIEGPSAAAPLTVNVSNPDDLRSVFKAAARKALGSGNIPDEQLERMVAAYQSMETGYQQTGGGVAVKPPDVDVFADEQLHKADPTAYDSNKVVNGLRSVFQAFGGAPLGAGGE